MSKVAGPVFCLALLLTGGAALAASPDGHAATSESDTGPRLLGSRAVALGLGGATAILTILLCVVPARVASSTKRRIERTVAESALTLQEEDRRRIARELHDGAGQALTAARLHLVALRQLAPPHSEKIAQIIAHLDEATEEVRRSTTTLAPPALAEFGLGGALARHCEGFADAAGLTVDFELPQNLPLLHSYVETACYRIVQEALHNAARHAGATRAWIRLRMVDHAVRLEIGDNGVGLVAHDEGGLGLDSIHERVRLAGGSIEIVDGRGPGARIRVLLPSAELRS